MITSESTDLRVGNLMTLDPIGVAPDASATEAETLLKTYRVSGLPVVSDRRLVGVVSQSDLMFARTSQFVGANWERLLVSDLMTSPAVTVHVEATVRFAAREMLARHIHRLVVVNDDGEPVGVVTPLDLLRVILDDPAELLS